MPTGLTSDGLASMCHSLPWRTKLGHLKQVLAGSPINRGVQTMETLIREAKGIAQCLETSEPLTREGWTVSGI
jgi:hypothetical protein